MPRRAGKLWNHLGSLIWSFLAEHCIPLDAQRRRVRATPPRVVRVIGGRGDLQHTADRLDPICGAMIVYAVLIVASRLVLLAHHPSDVVAGALIGMVGAMMVRYWFATRHLAFTIRGNGAIAGLTGPSATHLKRVARETFAP